MRLFFHGERFILEKSVSFRKVYNYSTRIRLTIRYDFIVPFSNLNDSVRRPCLWIVCLKKSNLLAPGPSHMLCQKPIKKGRRALFKAWIDIKRILNWILPKQIYNPEFREIYFFIYNSYIFLSLRVYVLKGDVRPSRTTNFKKMVFKKIKYYEKKTIYCQRLQIPSFRTSNT